ncbi:MAG: hypothetical protein FWH49_01160 [Clostridiales bacterium]|nr:hypothetical protein [Clostridiales bacterium]
MDDALMNELENLRAENKILRDSLVEIRPGAPEDGERGGIKSLEEITEMLRSAAEQAKENLSPGTEKVTAFLSKQMEENPVPMLLAAFGAGYLTSRRMSGK